MRRVSVNFLNEYLRSLFGTIKHDLKLLEGPKTVERMFPIRDLCFGLDINTKETGGARC